ncbi:TIGR02757 family protein [Bacteroidia bacterium]|nr:TIGR02757 family protein [Bacteroidia bacterium]
MTHEELRETLETLCERYNNADFIADDPIGIPHRYSRQEDIEISGFLSATIAWGNRKAIVRSCGRMMEHLDHAPFDFVVGASERELAHLASYVHRTFNGGDLMAFVLSLRQIAARYGSLGGWFQTAWRQSGDMRRVLSMFRREFFDLEHPARAEKHLSSIDKGAACKRLNMFLRWMVRRDDRGVDFGLWRDIPMSALYLPLDVHSGNTGRELGLLTRRQNDWKAVEEITEALRSFDPTDPVRYDFALFGVGINKG